MGIKGLLHKTNLIRLCASVLLAATALVSCQRDDIVDRNLVTLYPVVERNIETTVLTRALTGYSAYNSGSRQTIRAYAVNHDYTPGDEIATGLFSPSADGGWRSTLKVEADTSYYVYSYTSLPGATDYRLNFTGPNDVNLTFSGLSLISGTDPLVSTAAAGKYLVKNPAQVDYPELTEGSFSIGEVKTPANDKSTKVFLAMKHLFAKATLSFKVDPTYNELRTIKVKQVTVSTTAGGTLPGTHKINFRKNTDIAQLVKDETTSVSNESQTSVDILRGESSTATFDDPDAKDCVTLVPDSFIEFGWFTFLPATYLGGNNPSLSITVTYDVYDKSNPAVPLRQDQTATNGNILKNLTSGGAAGNNYRINLTVNPTYLIVLSDTDVSEGLEIEIN